MAAESSKRKSPKDSYENRRAPRRKMTRVKRLSTTSTIMVGLRIRLKIFKKLQLITFGKCISHNSCFNTKVQKENHQRTLMKTEEFRIETVYVFELNWNWNMCLELKLSKKKMGLNSFDSEVRMANSLNPLNRTIAVDI